MAMLLRLLGALQLLCRASGSGTAVNCSRSIDVKHCSCADNAEAPACAEFGDFCERDAACPLEKRCQWDSRKVPAGSFVGGCVDDVPCRSRSTSQECVCLHHPGSDSACLWSAEHGVCAARQESDVCSAPSTKASCLAHTGTFNCSWGKVCTMPCGGRGGGLRCCAWGDKCHFVAPSQPVCGDEQEQVATAVAAAAAVDVTKVHLVFSHHLDVGLDLALKATADCVGFATKILQRYFDEFFPRAIKLANDARAADGPKFVYQVHPWVVAMFMDCVSYTVQDNCPLNPGRLKCPTAAALGEFEGAVKRGDIVWHASPFNIDPGVVADPDLFEDIIGMVKDLDDRFGLNKTARVWSNVDVRGFVRSAIPLMAASGVDFLSINSNGQPKFCRGSNESGSLPICAGPQPAVGGNNATMFRWRDPISTKEVTVLFHDSYAHRFTPTASGFVTNRGESIITPNGIALTSYYRSDNTGPPSSYAEVQAIFKAAGEVFPGASVEASSFDAFAAEALTPAVVAALPVYEFEWGDKWVTGMSTDPQRLRVYREVVRARADCIEAGACSRQDRSIRNMTKYLAKISEHTQGEQNEQWNPGYRASGADLDQTHWSNADFATVHNNHTNIFQFGELSWLEARIFNTLAIAAAPPALKTSINRRLGAIVEKEAVLVPPVAGLTRVADLSQRLECGDDASVTFDAATGSLSQLKLGGQSWNGSLLRYTYVTYADDETWDARKNVKKLAQAEDKVWSANISALYHSASSGGGGGASCRIVAVLAMDAEAHSKYGAPSSGWLDIELDPEDGGALQATFQFRGKQTTRLGESMVVSFKPEAVPEHHWSMDVLGEWVRPEEVVQGGNYYSHAVNSGVKYATTTTTTTSQGGLLIETLDAGMAMPMAAPATGAHNDPLQLGESNPMGEGFPETPTMTEARLTGMAISLYQNLMPISGFAQWSPIGTGEFYQRQDEAMSFRFRLSAVAAG